jgi:hypothetical protein
MFEMAASLEANVSCSGAWHNLQHISPAFWEAVAVTGFFKNLHMSLIIDADLEQVWDNENPKIKKMLQKIGKKELLPIMLRI